MLLHSHITVHTPLVSFPVGPMRNCRLTWLWYEQLTSVSHRQETGTSVLEFAETK